MTHINNLIKKYIATKYISKINNTIKNFKGKNKSTQKISLKFIEKFNFSVFKNNKSVKKYDSDILLVNLPPSGSKHFPLALGYLSSYLKKNGINSKILDLNAYLYKNTSENFHWIWDINYTRIWENKKSFDMITDYFKNKIEKIINELIESDIKVIGFSVVNSKENITIEIIKRIKPKKPNTKIIIGGPSARIPETRKPLSEIYNLIDVFVVGEGEKTILDIVKNVKNNKSIRRIPGTLEIVNNKEFINSPRDELRPNEIVFPTYNQFDLSFYNKTIPITWSRGCLNKCVFCIEKEYWQDYRFRNPVDCYKELKYHYDKGYNNFIVYDSIINGDVKKLNKLLDLVIKNKLKIKWKAHVVAWDNLNLELFNKLKKAGCYELLFGIESGSDRILRLIKKGYNSTQASKILRLCKKSGISTTVNFISGFPGETEEDHEKTLEFIKKNKKNISEIGGIATLQILEGTDLGRDRAKYGIEENDSNFGNFWRSKNNNFEIRKKRAEEIISLVNSLNLRYERANTINDTPEETDKNIDKLHSIIKRNRQT